MQASINILIYFLSYPTKIRSVRLKTLLVPLKEIIRNGTSSDQETMNLLGQLKPVYDEKMAKRTDPIPTFEELITDI